MHTKDYLNKEIREEIEKKGFSIYNYISLKELLLTVNKDYLWIINILNIPLFIIFIIIIHSFISYFIPSIIITYSLIFIYLIGKLSFRTYKFSQITNILYTKKGLIIDNKIFHYEEDKELKDLLLNYEKIFDEYLSKPSRISENIKYLRKNIVNNFKKIFNFISGGERGNGLPIAFIVLVFYSITTFVLYYIGFILGFFLFFIFSFFINLYFKINKSTELKIKDNMTIIDNKLKKLDEIYLLLSKQIGTFQNGEISNLSNKIDKDMNIFYENINNILTYQDNLKNIIEQSIYKDFIDFEYLAFYIKTQFNKPLNDVIKLMSDYKSKVDNQIDEIENYLKNSNEKENYQVEQKLINLQTIQKNISMYLNKLKMSLQ
ncbi:hypothetical protein QUR79_03330 [Arcobacter cryaerophilus gv. pseudocryaerophilus]|uniref:Uncharacterized protein n=2 Tax=Arcobacteraceae TaxID=2808963 RepID=A0AAU0P7R0_9BACT|nr:hypothetical protein RJG54_11545 [Arcobacter sp. AZ-2023]WPD03929.1 hypothetical protein QUR79_03330 [Arcobacter sp. DSM 115972]